MFSTSDTIVAIATPPGRGGIGVVRLSGPDARAVASGVIGHRSPLEPRHATFTTVRLKPEICRSKDLRYNNLQQSSPVRAAGVAPDWSPARAADVAPDFSPARAADVAQDFSPAN